MTGSPLEALAQRLKSRQAYVYRSRVQMQDIKLSKCRQIMIGINTGTVLQDPLPLKPIADRLPVFYDVAMI